MMARPFCDFSLANRPGQTSLKAVLEPYELRRSLQLLPHEEITHSFVIVEDPPGLLKHRHTHAT